MNIFKRALTAFANARAQGFFETPQQSQDALRQIYAMKTQGQLGAILRHAEGWESYSAGNPPAQCTEPEEVDLLQMRFDLEVARACREENCDCC